MLQVTLFNRLWGCICWTVWIPNLHLSTSECLNTSHQPPLLSSTTGGTAGSKQARIPSGNQYDFHASLTTEGNIFELTCWMSRKRIWTLFVVVVITNMSIHLKLNYCLLFIKLLKDIQSLLWMALCVCVRKRTDLGGQGGRWQCVGGGVIGGVSQLSSSKCFLVLSSMQT